MPDFLHPRDAALIASRLKVIKGYPWDDEANKAIAECLGRWCRGIIDGEQVTSAKDMAEFTVSETIARCAKTGEDWQGPAQLRAVYSDLFERKPPEPSLAEQRRELTQKYGPPDPNWSTKLLKTAASGDKHTDFKAQRRAMLLQGVRDSLYYTEGRGNLEIEGEAKEKRISQAFWQEAMDHYDRHHPDEVAQARAEPKRGSAA